MSVRIAYEWRVWQNWTRICRLDSDLDGLTNGQELGDPDCTWKPGRTPSRSHDLSHPGLYNYSELAQPDMTAVTSDDDIVEQELFSRIAFGVVWSGLSCDTQKGRAGLDIVWLIFMFRLLPVVKQPDFSLLVIRPIFWSLQIGWFSRLIPV